MNERNELKEAVAELKYNLMREKLIQKAYHIMIAILDWLENILNSIGGKK